MAENSKIEWCDDSVSFWWGCQKIASGCANCYSEAGRGGKYFGQHPRLWIKTARESLLALDRKAEREGCKRLVFINSMSDLFEDYDGPFVDREGKSLVLCPDCGVRRNRWVGPLFFRENKWCVNCPECEREYGFEGGVEPLSMRHLRQEFFTTADECSNLILICLTKRPENILSMWPTYPRGSAPDGSGGRGSGTVGKKNIWLLTSVSEQETADRNWGHLVGEGGLTPVIGLSLEPLLGPIDIWQSCRNGPVPNWVIVGGESGPNARPCDIAWIRSIAQQCRDLDVPCFVKQLGSCSIARWDDPAIASLATAGQATSDTVQLGEHWQVREQSDSHGRIVFKHPKGGEPNEWPEDVRVREFPAGSEQPEGGPATKQ